MLLRRARSFLSTPDARVHGALVLYAMSLLGACSHSMKVPEKVAQNPALKVERYGGMREKELKVGGAVVTDITRSWSRPTGRGVVNFEKPPQETSVRYAFKYGDTRYAGSCVEHVRINMFGLKDPTVFLDCTCEDAQQAEAANTRPTLRASLSLEQQKGKATLSGFGSYQVSGVHQTETGKSRHEVLGYWFQSPTGEGAVDLEGDGRAFLPSGLTPEERPPMLCLYAGVLLHRPGQPL